LNGHRPWPGYGISSGSWQVGDFNGDGRADLFHAASPSTAHTWTAHANGSFIIGYPSPWPGYHFWAGSWRAADLNGDDRTDLVHFAGNGFVHTWIAQPSGAFEVGAFQPWPGYRF
jgi:hypothetical protein